MKKAIIVVAVVLSLFLLSQCGNEYDPDNWGAYYDWGDNHYWNSQSHSVERIPWK